MNLLPKSHKEFADSSYWEKFFQKRGKEAFEWYGEYLELCLPLHKYVKKNDKILMLGCGNSRLSMDMYDVGFKDLISIDISAVAIKGMKQQNAKLRPDLQFIRLDATDMSSEFTDNQFSVAIDKGTLDALFVDTSESVLETVEKYLGEVKRVLRVGGRYLCVTLMQKHILDYVLDYFPKNSFLLRIVYCRGAELAQKRNKADELDSGKDSIVMPVYMIVATKFTALPSPVLEFSFTIDKTDRLADVEQLANAVTSVQQAAMVCNGLARHSIAGHDEIILDVCRPSDGSVRYTAYIIEQPPGKHVGQFAALIVPRGRESEWLFSQPEGRRKMLVTVNYQRLALFVMHPDQEYGSNESIQLELSETIANLAPYSMLREKIPFLSIAEQSEDQCETLVKASSKMSGEFTIEEITTADGKIMRRIIFANNPRVTQSEALIRLVKAKGKKKRKRVDFGYLACLHHIYMSVAVQKVVIEAKELGHSHQNVLVIGLGGGSLCSFLQKALPTVRIVAVEIDPMMLEIAEQYFDLKLDDRLHVVIDDGLKFIEKCRQENMLFDAILFDVDNKDVTVGMNCPPAEFLERSVLNNIKGLLSYYGLFILNLVCRNDSLRTKVLEDLKEVFPAVRNQEMNGYLNQIVHCSNDEKLESGEDWNEKIILSISALNDAVKENINQSAEIFATTEMMKNLKV